MLIGLVALVLSDACAKMLSAQYPVSQVVALRALVVMLILVLVARHQRSLRIVNARGHALRALFAASSSYLFIFGLTALPLADASAAAFAGPLFLTALAGPLLGESVGWRRWSAVLMGFVGVLIMLRPSPSHGNWFILIPVAAAAMGALRDVVTRRISITDNATSILFTTNTLVMAVGLPFITDWQALSLTHFGFVLASGVLIGVGHYLHIEAFRLTEASLLAPFRYSSIVWSVLFGFLLFGDLPDRAIIAGGALVITSGLYIMHRERQLLSRARDARGPPR